jgi:hypothetical protein
MFILYTGFEFEFVKVGAAGHGLLPLGYFIQVKFYLIYDPIFLENCKNFVRHFIRPTWHKTVRLGAHH